MFERTVLGVDPGVARSGLAVVGQDGGRATLLWAAAVRTGADRPEAERLASLARAVRQALDAHRADVVAVERVAFNRNAVSALNVARATGAVMAAVAEEGLAVAEYSPTEVKIAVTGVGNADKEQVRDALIRIHGLRDVPDQADAADAVAVAMTHLAGERLRAAVGRAG